MRSRWIAFALALAGCDKPAYTGPLRGYSCRCSALTDTDVPRTVDVDVCAQHDSESDKVALGCAKARTPMLVQSCKCGPGKNCDPGWCGAK